MREMIHDIIEDPREYWPILVILVVVLLVWGSPCVGGLFSLRASTQRRRLWFARAPLVFGLIGVCAQIPLSLKRDDFRFNFGWLLLVPLLMGGTGFAFYWRARQMGIKRPWPCLMLCIGMAMLVNLGCEEHGKTTLNDLENRSNQVTQVFEELSRKTGIILPSSGVVLLRADDGGGRDLNFGYYRWAVFSPSALAMPPFQAKGANSYLDMPLPSTLRVIEGVVGKGKIGKPKAAFCSEWQTNNYEYRGTLLRSSEGDYLVVEQFKQNPIKGR